MKYLLIILFSLSSLIINAQCVDCCEQSTEFTTENIVVVLWGNSNIFSGAFAQPAIRTNLSNVSVVGDFEYVPSPYNLTNNSALNPMFSDRERILTFFAEYWQDAIDAGFDLPNLILLEVGVGSLAIGDNIPDYNQFALDCIANTGTALQVPAPNTPIPYTDVCYFEHLKNVLATITSLPNTKLGAIITTTGIDFLEVSGQVGLESNIVRIRQELEQYSNSSNVPWYQIVERLDPNAPNWASRDGIETIVPFFENMRNNYENFNLIDVGNHPAYDSNIADNHGVYIVGDNSHHKRVVREWITVQIFKMILKEYKILNN